MGARFSRLDYMVVGAMGSSALMYLVDLAGPKSVYDADHARHKNFDVLPETHVESSELHDLKEKYPQYKDN